MDASPTRASREAPALDQAALDQELVVSETFVSIQGEGVSVGEPAAFLRLGNCNLACSYCDTPYTWDERRFRLETELKKRSLTELSRWVADESPGRLIVTGGEPLIQHKRLQRLVDLVDQRRARTVGAARLFVEVETNGTILPHEALLARVDQWNVSPKLGNSGEPSTKRIRPSVLRGFAETGRAFFKFVVSDERDVEEVRALSEELSLDPSRTLFMPEARTAGELRQRAPQVQSWALGAGVRYSGRVHLEMFGGKRGY